MTMIERIARAMSVVSEAREPGFLPFDKAAPYIREQWMELARAATQALREPSDEVLRCFVHLELGLSVPEDRAEAWVAAIEAILAEQS